MDAIQQPLREGWVAQGRQVKAFERSFSQHTGAEISIACSSGTAALHLACAAFEVKPGDEVIVPALTWVATANVVELLGAKPVFCDIDLDTFNIHPSALDVCLTKRTVGIIPVHLFGLCAEMDPVISLAEARKLWTIEDAACALGGSYRGQHAGTMGDAGCFSFHPRKSITTGEGGMITVADDALARMLDGLRNHGAVPALASGRGSAGHTSLLPSYGVVGFNYRLTDIQAALGVVQMQRLNWLLAERNRCAEYYADSLSDVGWLRLPRAAEHQHHAWQSYVALFASEIPDLTNVAKLHEQRNGLMAHLEAEGVSTRPGTHAPPHLDYYSQKYGYRPEDFPNAYLADRLSIALPLYPGMTEAELAHVSASVRTFDPRA